jgi:hypothetical protein
MDPYKSKTPSPMKTKLSTTNYVRGTPQGQNVIISPSKGPTKDQLINFLFLVFFFIITFFYFVRFLARRPVKTARPILTIYRSNDAVSHKEVPLGVLTPAKIAKGFIFPQTTKTGHAMGISNLNKRISNYSTAHAISAQISSIYAACRKKPNFFTESLKIHSRGTLKNVPNGDFKPKHPVEQLPTRSTDSH